MPRRQFQIGPSTFSLTEAGALWLVRECFSLCDRNGDRDDGYEDFSGPFTADEAQREILRLELDRGARQMGTHC